MPPICSEELDVLQATLKRWCENEKIEISSPRAEEAAIELIDWYQFGLKHPDQLIEMLNRASVFGLLTTALQRRVRAIYWPGTAATRLAHNDGPTNINEAAPPYQSACGAQCPSQQ